MAEKLSITLPEEMVALAKTQAKDGRVASVSEVLREAPRTWFRQEAGHGERIASIRGRIDKSITDSRPRVPLDAAFERLERRRQLAGPYATMRR